MSRRRQTLIALGILSALPSATAQQPGRIYRLGWLSPATFRTESYSLAFVGRLRELGFIEGRNLVIEFRSAGGRLEKLPEYAAELSRQNCDVYFAPSAEAVLVALKAVVRDRPVVFASLDCDAVARGHVASLARPGGHITGVTQLTPELAAKRVEILKELLPNATRFAVFADRASQEQLARVRSAALRLGLLLQEVEFQNVPYDYHAAYREVVRQKADALVILTSGFFAPARKEIVDLAIKNRIPTILNNSLWVDAGGLISYGASFNDTYRRAADKIGLILRGAKPADIPIEQPNTVEIVINLKTARALGLSVPDSIRVRADRVIE